MTHPSEMEPRELKRQLAALSRPMGSPEGLPPEAWKSIRSPLRTLASQNLSLSDCVPMHFACCPCQVLGVESLSNGSKPQRVPNALNLDQPRRISCNY